MIDDVLNLFSTSGESTEGISCRIPCQEAFIPLVSDLNLCYSDRLALLSVSIRLVKVNFFAFDFSSESNDPRSLLFSNSTHVSDGF